MQQEREMIKAWNNMIGFVEKLMNNTVNEPLIYMTMK